ncbi:MAG TPA: class I adenylate-forming enzyme family protein [Conexibacter sp.]|nr:class I adenylate-forming enzyme family protein [Conexibacter sp.]
MADRLRTFPRTGLRSLLRAQLEPRVRLREPTSIGVLPRRAADTFGRVPIYLDRPLDVDPQRRTELDYVEHALLVEQLSAAFHAAGVRPWDRVAVVKQPSFDVLTLAAAIARLGAIPALVSPRLDGEILAVLLERLRAPFTFTDQATVEAAGLPFDRWHAPGSRVIGAVEGGLPLDQLWGGAVPAATPRRDDEPVVITHTSSTTGISKMAENSVAGVGFMAFLEALPPFAHSRRELVASCISFVHVRAVITTMAALSRGSSLLPLSRTDDETVIETFARHRPTAVETHPNVFVRWERLCDHPDDLFANVRIYLNSFDAAHPRTIERFLAASRRTLPVWFQVYGQTEVQGISIRGYRRGGPRRMSRRGTRTRSLGWPLPGVRVRIVDPVTQRRALPGRPGMIQVRTPGRALQFVGTPEKYWERRHGGWFDTGDWGRRGARGDIEIFDRVADRIDGVKSCLWIEDALMSRIPQAAEVVVVPDAAGLPVPVLCMRDGARLEPADWRAAAEGLPPLGEPVEVAEADLKRTATEKARRYLLSELVSARHRAEEAPAAHDRVEVLLREGA